MKYKIIIFDVGDTLLEYYPSQAQIYEECLSEMGLTAERKKIKRVIDNASHEQIAGETIGAPRMSDEDFKDMLDKAALSCVEFEGDVSDAETKEYLQILKGYPQSEQELKIIPGVIETLDKLKKDFRLAVVSNHRKELLGYLKELGLSDYFESIVVSEIVGCEKPDIKIMQIALDELQADASECLYVGDHPFDVLCAKGAGIDCAWLTNPESVLPDSIPHTEDYKISELSEIVGILAN